MPYRTRRTHHAESMGSTAGPTSGEDTSSTAADASPPIHVAARGLRARRHRVSPWNLLIGLCLLAAAGSSLVWMVGRWQSSRVGNVPQAAIASPAPTAPAPPPVDRPDATSAGDEDPANEVPDFPPFGGDDAAGPFISRHPVQPQNRIDELVFSKLTELGIQPAALCSDAVFLRRLYTDVLGTLPTADEAARFLDDSHPDKRAELVEAVLQRPEFADYLAMRWCDVLRVKAEFPINLWPSAAQAYHRWIHTAIRDDMPYDVFAFELLTASGSNFRKPQVNFYRALQSTEPKALAQAVALTFMGRRAEQWPAEKLEGLSVFFSQVGYKPTGEWKEEIVYFDPRKAPAQDSATPPMAFLPSGAPVSIEPGHDPRQIFAQWLVNGRNPWFTHVIANRVWFWLNGRGIVDPPDDLRADNPPVHPELLDYLADELVDADFDLKHLYRLILNSHTYQLSSIPRSEHPDAARHFAFYPTRRLDAEVLIDAICQITQTTEVYSSIIPEPFTFLPDNQRAIALPDGSITSAFLEMFGRPSRDTGLESDRNSSFSAAQALHLLNSNHIRQKLKDGPGIQELLSRSDGAERLYLAILSRRPTSAEMNQLYDLWGYGQGREIAWALINSDEFLFRH